MEPENGNEREVAAGSESSDGLGGWIVELYGAEQFLANWQGDPGRTCVRASAKRYKSKHAAQCALSRAKRVYPNRDYSLARVVPA